MAGDRSKDLLLPLPPTSGSTADFCMRSRLGLGQTAPNGRPGTFGWVNCIFCSGVIMTDPQIHVNPLILRALNIYTYMERRESVMTASLEAEMMQNRPSEDKSGRGQSQRCSVQQIIRIGNEDL